MAQQEFDLGRSGLGVKRGHELAKRQLFFDRQASPRKVVHANHMQIAVKMNYPDVKAL
jgi:hypothetical protein